MKIAIDAFGGDHAPTEIIKGVVDAVNAEPGFTAVLFGAEETVRAELSRYAYPADRIEVVDAPEVIGNDESPTEGVRKKKNSSIVKAFHALNTDDAYGAFVSAGSTGAVLTGAVLLLKRIRGINRPALAPVLPTVNGGQVVLVDCGANADCKPLNLVQFARMGKAYANTLGISDPKIGLLSNGTEDKKGNELNKETFPLLKEDASLNFVGNIEGRDILGGAVDVVVTDGFSGNVALKSCEGTALTMFEVIKQNILGGGLRAKIGYLLLKPAFRRVKNVMDYNNKGGAVLLGLQKIVVKSHGSSKAKSITASVLQAYNLCRAGIVDAIAGAMVTASEE